MTLRSTYHMSIFYGGAEIHFFALIDKSKVDF